MKKVHLNISAIFLLCLLSLFYTNPNPAQYERFVLKGLNGNEIHATNFKDVFSNIELNKVVTRDNFGFFSIYEFSPSLIASMDVPPGTLSLDTSDIRVRFIGIGNEFFGLSGSENGVKFMSSYLELCRTGAIDCRKFIKKYRL